MALCLAIDVGGTKLAAGLVDDRGQVLAEQQVPTPHEGDAEQVFATLAGLVDRIRADPRPDKATNSPGDALVCCGVGCGGPMTSDTVSPLNIGAWRSFPLMSRLAESTGLPTFVDNDAKALALGEGWLGAAAGRQDYLAMVVSTGVGAGIVLDGRLLDGRTGNAGHIGHVVVVPDGRRCSCGGRGCLEAEAAGPAIAAVTGRPASEADQAVVARTGRLVGRAVASTANLLDLDLAVVAGSVALGFGQPFFAAAQAELDALACLDFSSGTSIVPAGLGRQGPLVGAAAVAWRAMAGAGAWPAHSS